MRIRMLCWACLFISLIACTTEKDVLVSTPEPPVAKQYSYLALGDSYTIGESVDPSERYPVQLADSLAKADLSVESVDIVARTGWTTAELQAGINQRTDLSSGYDLVSLLIGVNNQYRGYAIDEYTVEFQELLEQAIDFAGGNTDRVFVISIPDYAYTPFGQGNGNISSDIDAFNAVNQSITEDYNIRYFNITPISRQGLQEPSLVAADGLHPSGQQYSRWVSIMLHDVKELLR